MVSSSAHGNATSAIEVTTVSSCGLSLLWDGKERFLPYEDFPWFRGQPAKYICNIQQPAPGHFHWPDLDVDLTDEMIDHPERFPLKAKQA